MSKYDISNMSLTITFMYNSSVSTGTFCKKNNVTTIALLINMDMAQLTKQLLFNAVLTNVSFYMWIICRKEQLAGQQDKSNFTFYVELYY